MSRGNFPCAGSFLQVAFPTQEICIRDDAPLSDHVETTVQAIARLHAEHDTSATPMERLCDGVTAWLGRPASLAILAALVCAWITGNVLVRAFDPPPFVWLELSMTTLAAMMTIVILASQRRSDRFSEHREQLMLQLAYSSDQRLAKIISLIEELRRDDPLIENRPDRQAEAMTEPSDPEAVEQAIAKTRQEMVEGKDD